MRFWVLVCVCALASAAASAFETTEHDVVLKNFHFRTGETLPEVRMHYLSLGEPKRDAKGEVTNAVMVLHGTGGTGRQFLRPQFADVLFAPGGALDPARYFIILPDNLGHGKSTKPSDGLRAKFPRYDYDDMVEAEYRMLTEGLKIHHLRLMMGTSMGCMQSFVWAETHPDFASASMPMACLPVPIAGRNRMWRKMVIDAIENDPDYRGGDYAQEPKAGLRAAADLLIIAGSVPLPWQKTYPTRQAADDYVEHMVKTYLDDLDGNDLIRQVDASRNYDPSPRLDAIKVPMVWINSADDFINPPELGIAEAMAPRIKSGRFTLLPISENGHGHGTHTWAVFWQDQLKDLLARTEKP